MRSEHSDAATRITVAIAAGSDSLATALASAPPELRAALAVALMEFVRWFVRRYLPQSPNTASAENSREGK